MNWLQISLPIITTQMRSTHTQHLVHTAAVRAASQLSLQLRFHKNTNQCNVLPAASLMRFVPISSSLVKFLLKMFRITNGSIEVWRPAFYPHSILSIVYTWAVAGWTGPQSVQGDTQTMQTLQNIIYSTVKHPLIHGALYKHSSPTDHHFDLFSKSSQFLIIIIF